MNATQQFYEMVAQRYYEIERMKRAAYERGEVLVHLAKARVSGEISEAEYQSLKYYLTGDGAE